MSCENGACGTGGYTGPKPGDPDNDSVTLSANAVFGGIEVQWTYPTVNPYAVAHTLLYRGPADDFVLATQRAVAAGSVFYDKLDPEVSTQYYYWIQLVSVNGTVGERIGPVSAYARPMVEDTLETLTGRIDSGVLAHALKTEIGNITMLNGQISQEIQNRFDANTALSLALADVQSGAEDAMAFVQEEITQRTEGDSALVQVLNTLATAVDQNVAAIFEEKTVRTSSFDSLADTVTILFTKVDQTASAVQTEANARSSADNALANQITTTQTSLNNNIASVQTSLQSTITAVDGKVTQIGALYTAKVSVNGLIGGFGVYNDGREVQAGFDVDTFWVGRTGADKVKPFIISNGVVYIDTVRIRDATIDTLKITNNAVTSMVSASGGQSASLGIVTTGGPVFICAVGRGYGDLNGDGYPDIHVNVYCDGSLIGTGDGVGWPAGPDQSAAAGSVPVVAVHTPSAGYHTYSFNFVGSGISINGAVLETKR